ncbi:vesicular integral-membrane protein VIP36 [Pelomyxa schiedti]|nr:vesicular integral-membrane protein VIP36 [Pelomyxa schiedti]
MTGWEWGVALVAVVCLIIGVDSKETNHSLHSFNLGNWKVTGDASMFERWVRLAPDRQAKKGGFWSQIPNTSPDWEVEYQFKIHGVSRIGADGMAFWYLTQRSSDTPMGSLFGNTELFNGLGIIVDTYDNDAKGIHPWVFALLNDGTYKFSESDHNHIDHTRGGTVVRRVGEVNGCTVHMRNLATPSIMLVTYQARTLSVKYKLYNLDEWQTCFTAPSIDLPTGGYFGFSAATGDLADNHDVYDVIIRDLRQKTPPPKPQLDRFVAADIERIKDRVHDDIDNGISTLNTITERSAVTVKSLTEVVNGLKDIPKTTSGGVAPTAIPDSLAVSMKGLQNLANTKDFGAKDLTSVLKQIQQEAQKVPAVKGNSSPGWGMTIALLVCVGLSVCACVVLTKKIGHERRPLF